MTFPPQYHYGESKDITCCPRPPRPRLFAGRIVQEPPPSRKKSRQYGSLNDQVGIFRRSILIPHQCSDKTDGKSSKAHYVGPFEFPEAGRHNERCEAQAEIKEGNDAFPSVARCLQIACSIDYRDDRPNKPSGTIRFSRSLDYLTIVVQVGEGICDAGGNRKYFTRMHKALAAAGIALPESYAKTTGKLSTWLGAMPDSALKFRQILQPLL